ncbi:hypothetical protein F5X96DRAFT_629674 [Biscogniauxia mediterranea]|nr:hypothetical protein F5X96DRAFT_629674 [Biscogniauxia mediterranea]
MALLPLFGLWGLRNSHDFSAIPSGLDFINLWAEFFVLCPGDGMALMPKLFYVRTDMYTADLSTQYFSYTHHYSINVTIFAQGLHQWLSLLAWGAFLFYFSCLL